MKKLIFFLGFSLFVSHLTGQNQMRIDSLLIKLQKEKRDTVKVDILNDLSRESTFNKIGIDYANKALSLALNVDYEKGIIYAYINLINYNYEAQREKSIDYFNKAVHLCKIRNQKSLLARLNLEMSKTSWYGNITKSEEYAFKALELFDSLKDSANMAETSLQLSYLYSHYNTNLSLQDPKKGLKYLKSSYDWYNKQKNLIRMAECFVRYNQIYNTYYTDSAISRYYLNLATKTIDEYLKKDPKNIEYKICQYFNYEEWSVFYRIVKKDSATAIKMMSKAVELGEQVSKMQNFNYKHNRTLAICYYCLGDLYFGNNQRKKGDECYIKSVETVEKVDLVQAFDLSKGLSNALIYNNEYVLAYKYNDLNHKIAEKIRDPKYLIESESNLISFYWAMNDYENALKYAQMLYNLAKANSNYGFMAFYLNTISNIHLKLNRNDSALFYLQKSDELNNKYSKDSLVSVFNLSVLAKIYEEKKEFEKAIAIYNKVLEIRNRNNWYVSIETPYGKIDTYGSLAKIYFNLKRYDSAFNFVQKSLSSIDKTKTAKNNEELSEDYFILSNIYEMQGKPAKALEYYKKYISLKTQVVDMLAKNNIYRIEIKRIEEQKAVEIDKLNVSNRMKENKLKQQKIFTYTILFGFALVLIFAIAIYRGYKQKIRINHLLKTRENQINERNQQLQQLNEEVILQKEELQTTLENLRQTQAELIQSEKMASLGQLIAGIAHEINTPLGAINASITTISNSSAQSIKLLPVLVKSLSDSELELFMVLVNRSVTNPNILTSKEEREIRKSIAEKLLNKGIAEAEDLADILVDIGIYNDIETFLQLIRPTTLEAAYHLSMQIKNSNNIKMAVERASKVVFALKNYARYGNEDSMVAANVIDGLETVLILYHNQLKHGINIHKEFEEVPLILCYPDELNQVWTNLIHNAIQAMEGKGDLTISVSKTLPAFTSSTSSTSTSSMTESVTDSATALAGLEIRITDTGKGIAPEIKDRIFDAFFTTKARRRGRRARRPTRRWPARPVRAG